jgi:hypothetical protein
LPFSSSRFPSSTFCVPDEKKKAEDMPYGKTARVLLANQNILSQKPADRKFSSVTHLSHDLIRLCQHGTLVCRTQYLARNT